MRLPWSKPSPLGIDVGARTVKGLKLKKKNGKVFLDKYFFYDLAEGNAKFPAVQGLSDTIKALVEVGGLKNAPVAACVDDSDVATFDLNFPPMPDADLREAIANEIEPRLGYPISEAAIDHVILARSNSEGEESLTVRAFCARLSEINLFSDLLQAANLKPQSIDVAMLSNIAMLNFNGYLENDVFTIVIDLGESKTSMALVRGQKLLVTNMIQVSFGSINRRLQTAVGLNYQQAEEIKVKSAQAHEEDSAAYNIVDEVYLELFQQIQRSFEFFRVTAQGHKLARVLLIGGGAQFSAVRAGIEATFNIETVVANPFRNIEIFEKGQENNERLGQIAPQMGTVVGLALRGLDGD